MTKTQTIFNGNALFFFIFSYLSILLHKSNFEKYIITWKKNSLKVFPFETIVHINLSKINANFRKIRKMW